MVDVSLLTSTDRVVGARGGEKEGRGMENPALLLPSTQGENLIDYRGPLK